MPPPIQSNDPSLASGVAQPTSPVSRFTAFVGKIFSALKSIGRSHDTHVQPLSQRQVSVVPGPLQSPIKLLRQAVHATELAHQQKIANLQQDIARLQKEIQHESLGLDIRTFDKTSLKKVETHVTDPAAIIHDDAKFDKLMHELGNKIGLNHEISSFDQSTLKKTETKIADPLNFLRDDPNKDKLTKQREKFDDQLESKLKNPPALKHVDTKVSPNISKQAQVQSQLDKVQDETALRPQPLKPPTAKGVLIAEPTLAPITPALANAWGKTERKALADQLATKINQYDKLIASGKNDDAKVIQAEITALADKLGKVIGQTFAQHAPSSQPALALGTGAEIKTEIWKELQAANKKLPDWVYGGPDSDYDGGNVPRDWSLQKQFLDRVYSTATAQFDTHIGEGRPPSLTFHGDEYKPVRLLGSGGGGVVHLYQGPKGELVALKLMKASDESMVGADVEAARKEFSTHLALMGTDGKGHPNVLGIKAIGRSPDGTPVAILDLAPLGDVKKLIEDRIATAEKKGLLTPQAAHLVRLLAFRDTIMGMIYAQEKLGLRHGDLKPGNFFIGDDALVKLADFGTSTFEPAQQVGKDTAEGTFLYQAPELFAPTGTVTPKADTWALGVMAHQMFNKSFPFESKYVAEHGKTLTEYAAKGDVTGMRGVVTKMAEDFDQREDVVGATALDRLLNAMMHPDPEKRPALSAVLGSSIFDDLGKPPDDKTDAVRELIRALMSSGPDDALIKQKSDALGV